MSDFEMPTLIPAWIEGRAEVPTGSAPIELRDPADGSELTAVATADAATVDRAIDAARCSFTRGDWARASAAERAQVLRAISSGVREQAEELAALDSRCTGTPWRRSTIPQAQGAAGWFSYFADLLLTEEQQLHPQLPDALTLVTREPAGVAALMTPWNVPLGLAALKLAAALAAGNSCVLKPSELSPLGALKLVQLAERAGLPRGVLNLVNGPGTLTGAALASHRGIDRLSFTGGGFAGRAVNEAAARNFVPTTLELGGKSAAIVLADADLDLAVDGILLSSFSNNGQACLASSRLLIHDAVYEAFRDRLLDRVARIRQAAPLDPDCELGPLVTEAHRQRTLAHIQAAVRDGETLLCGGKAPEGAGNYLTPAVFESSSNASALNQTELFAPVVSLQRVRDVDDVISRANDSPYGLVAYLYGEQTTTLLQCARALAVGTVLINSPMQRAQNAPFGGYRQSGSGREGGRYSLNFFSEAKTIILPTGPTTLRKLGTGKVREPT